MTQYSRRIGSLDRGSRYLCLYHRAHRIDLDKFMYAAKSGRLYFQKRIKALPREPWCSAHVHGFALVILWLAVL